jgi:hypothetical protein
LEGAGIAKGVNVILAFHQVETGKAKRLHIGLLDADPHGIAFNGGAYGLIPNAVIDDVLGF